jgi:taurine dioxygenase
VVEDLRAALDKHGLLVVREQDHFQPEDHIALAQCFGDIFPLPPRFQHARAPHRDILRVSNHVEEGFTGVGTSGWHIDGVSYETPFSFAIMRIESVSADGPTLFLPLQPLAERLIEEKLSWQNLAVLCGKGEQKVRHPLLFTNPRTRQPGVVLGKLGGLVWAPQAGIAAEEREAGPEELAATLDELDGYVACHAQRTAYRHQWQAGDLLLVDNLAVAHLAAPATQAPPEEGGLRVLHRVVVAGVEPLTPAAGPAKPSAAPQPSMAARGPAADECGTTDPSG